MRSLNSICRARDEARYISRSWSNQSSAQDKPWPIHYTPKVESPDDIIQVCVLNPATLSGLGTKQMKRSEYEANKAKYQADIAQWEAEQNAKRKATK